MGCIMFRVRVAAFWFGFLLGLVMAELTPYFLVALFLLIGIALLAANVYIIYCAVG